MIADLLLLLAGSFLLCLALTPLARGLASRAGLVDRPDDRRKTHARPVPVAGGLAVLGSGGLVLAAALLLPSDLAGPLAEDRAALLGLLLGAVVICAVGVADDCGCLRGRHKLLGQILAVLIVIQLGVVVRSVRIFDWHVDLGLLAVPCTVLWLLGAINSLNLIDGMDGLLGSVGVIIALAFAVMAMLGGKWAAAAVALTLAGSLLGFLVYNFPPASVFLGDAGSMLIGLVVGTLAIRGSLKGPATVALVAPAALLTIPFLDTAAAIVRRTLTGRSIYTTDHGHLHHCLLRRGLSPRRVLLWVSLCCLLTGAGVLASLALEQELFALLAAAAVVAILLVSRLFGHAEFLLLKRHVGRFVRSFLRLGPHGEAQRTEVRLQGSLAWAALWSDLTAWAPELNVTMLRLNVNAPALREGYHARWACAAGAPEDANRWSADVPLTVQGHALGRLEVVGQRNGAPVWKKIAVVLTLVEHFEEAAAALLGGVPTNGDGTKPPPARDTGTAVPGPHSLHVRGTSRDTTAANGRAD